MTSRDHTRDEPPTGPVIRDRRRIDPATGQVREQGSGEPRGKHAREPAGAGERGQAGADAGAGRAPRPEPASDKADMPEMTAQLAERTADLQRLQAEYANYRKRVDRDRQAVREQALANVLAELLPILDDIGRAREHGELSGGFKSVAEALEATVGKLGLVRYGEQGEAFDPNVHEALLHSYSAEVTEPACVQILQPGYKVGDRILRPARVAVAEPGGGESEESGGESGGTGGETERAGGESEGAAGDAGETRGGKPGKAGGARDAGPAGGGSAAPGGRPADQPPEPPAGPDPTA